MSSAVQFNGSDPNALKASAGPGSSGFTVCGFFNVTAEPTGGDYATFAVVSDANGVDGANFLFIGLNASGVLCATYASGEYDTALTPTLGSWYFFAATQASGGAVTFYYKALGATSLTSASAFTNTSYTSTEVLIGDDDAGDPSDAAMCGVRVWSTVLTAAQLLTESFEIGAAERATGLFADWWLQGASDTTDHSGNGHTLTAEGTGTSTATGPPVWLFPLSEDSAGVVQLPEERSPPALSLSGACSEELAVAAVSPTLEEAPAWLLRLPEEPPARLAWAAEETFTMTAISVCDEYSAPMRRADDVAGPALPAPGEEIAVSLGVTLEEEGGAWLGAAADPAPVVAAAGAGEELGVLFLEEASPALLVPQAFESPPRLAWPDEGQTFITIDEEIAGARGPVDAPPAPALLVPVEELWPILDEELGAPLAPRGLEQVIAVAPAEEGIALLPFDEELGTPAKPGEPPPFAAPPIAAEEVLGVAATGPVEEYSPPQAGAPVDAWPLYLVPVDEVPPTTALWLEETGGPARPAPELEPLRAAAPGEEIAVAVIVAALEEWAAAALPAPALEAIRLTPVGEDLGVAFLEEASGLVLSFEPLQGAPWPPPAEEFAVGLEEPSPVLVACWPLEGPRTPLVAEEAPPVELEELAGPWVRTLADERVAALGVAEELVPVGLVGLEEYSPPLTASSPDDGPRAWLLGGAGDDWTPSPSYVIWQGPTQRPIGSFFGVQPIGSFVTVVAARRRI